MIEIVCPEADYELLRSRLLFKEVECCAVLFALKARAGNKTRLLVREVAIAQPQDYSTQSPIRAELNPILVAHVAKRAKLEGLSLVFVHSHLGGEAPRFSAVDDAGEKHLSDFLDRRGLGADHGALVISEGGADARRLGGDESARFVVLGDRRTVVADINGSNAGVDPLFDRQVRAFGARGQQILGETTFGIVGLGGIGSLIAEQLAHLGVQRFVLIDPDHVELSNLNRIVGARRSDIGVAKVQVAATLIKGIKASASVEQVIGDITRISVAQKLVATDFLFGCTDSHGSRAVLQQIAYQYFIPCIDMGVVIDAHADLVEGMFGRVQMLTPGRACLTCTDLLSSEQIRRDMMSPEERAKDSYILGGGEPAPAVISLNGTVASIAITMMMSALLGIPGHARHLIYDAKKPALRAVRAEPKANCFICSKDGAMGRGDSQQLFARRD